MSDLNPYEQYLLELINRARADPGAEAARLGIDLNQGLAPGRIQDTAKQPLAANEFLNDAAADHSSWMLQTNQFSHTGQGGSSAGDRIEDAGYENWRTWGENISYRGGGNVRSVSVVEGHHDGLFKSSGHRTNLLNNGFTEIGLGQEYGTFNGFNASMLTENFASDRGDPFLLGVVFDDQDGDDFFDPGEELPNVTVSVASEGSDATGAGGGYEIRIGGEGRRSVTFSGGGLAAPIIVSVVIGAENVKLDLNIDDLPEPTPTPEQPKEPAPIDPVMPEEPAPETPVAETPDPTAPDDTPDDPAPDQPAPEGPAFETPVAETPAPETPTPLTPISETPAGSTPQKLRGGEGDDRMSGSDSAEVMLAGRGADVVRGLGGDDLIRGQGGADKLVGGSGDDTLIGGAGADRLKGGGGADNLRGGSGADTLKGGGGADNLTGNGGADVFQFGSRNGSDIITDFAHGPDRIEILNGADDFADLTLLQLGSDVQIAFGATTVIVLDGTLSDFTAQDFLF